MKSMSLVVMVLSMSVSSLSLADELRDVQIQPQKIQVVPVPARPIARPPAQKLAPIPAAYVLSDSMTSDEVFAIASKEFALLAKLVAEYGPRPEFAALEKAANEHFAEATRRLGDEVKKVLEAASAPETPEQAFRREVEALGREVSAILSQGSIGSNAPRYSATTQAPGTVTPPAASAGTAKGAGMARD